MAHWKGSKHHPKCVAVHRSGDPEGERTVIREVDFDAATMSLFGDGSVDDYDPTTTANDVVEKNKAALEKLEREGELEAAIEKVVKKKEEPAKRGRPSNAEKAAREKGE
jgi:hypothetical protein